MESAAKIYRRHQRSKSGEGTQKEAKEERKSREICGGSDVNDGGGETGRERRKKKRKRRKRKSRDGGGREGSDAARWS